MSFKDFKVLIDKITSIGITDFRLTGGEPTLHPDFVYIIDYLVKKNIKPRLITNGIRLAESGTGNSKRIIDKLTHCWVSVYGISEEQHQEIGGSFALPLKEMFRFVRDQKKSDCNVGISVLLTDVKEEELTAFLCLAQNYEIKNLRFLFGEPTVLFGNDKKCFQLKDDDDSLKPKDIICLLRKPIFINGFDSLSISNPFSLGENDDYGVASCLLKKRRLWSISTSGNIYSCCFNVYQSDHYIENAFFVNNFEKLVEADAHHLYSYKCKALKYRYWHDECCIQSCPISFLNLK